MKGCMKGGKWRNAATVDTSETFLLYSAFDVNPLLDLYHAMLPLIDPDFLPFVDQL